MSSPLQRDQGDSRDTGTCRTVIGNLAAVVVAQWANNRRRCRREVHANAFPLLCSIILSDGVCYATAMLATILNPVSIAVAAPIARAVSASQPSSLLEVLFVQKVASGEICNNAVVRVLEYSTSVVQDRKYVSCPHGSGGGVDTHEQSSKSMHVT